MNKVLVELENFVMGRQDGAVPLNPIFGKLKKREKRETLAKVAVRNAYAIGYYAALVDVRKAINRLKQKHG